MVSRLCPPSQKNQYMCAPDQVHPKNPHVWKINACVWEHALPEIAMHLSIKFFKSISENTPLPYDFLQVLTLPPDNHNKEIGKNSIISVNPYSPGVPVLKITCFFLQIYDTLYFLRILISNPFPWEIGKNSIFIFG